MTDDVDRNRRHFLAVATAVTGGAGIALAAIPFIASLKPSARAEAQGAPVEVAVGSLEPGEMIRVIWRGRLVFILRRSEDMLARLPMVTEFLDDPDSLNPEQQPNFAVNEYRSLKREFLVITKNEQEFIKNISSELGFTFQETRQLVDIALDVDMWDEGTIEKLWPSDPDVRLSSRARKEYFLSEIQKKYFELKSSLKDYSNFNSGEVVQGNVNFVPAPAGSKILGLCPVAGEKTRCCNLLTMDVVLGCAFDCSYCTIQSYYHDNAIMVERNLKEKLGSLKLDPNEIYHIGTGQSSDSLLWGNRDGILEKLFEFATENANVILELKTKSDNVEEFLNLSPPRNVIATWTLNTPTVIKNEERLTSSLNERINAARKVADNGTLVGFHFHPMVWYRGWEEEYEKAAGLVMENFDPKEVAMISFGTLTYIKPVIRKLRKRRIKSKSLQMPFEDAHGKLSYPKDIKISLFKKAYQNFSSWHGRVFFYLCMEAIDIWNPVFGFEFQDNDEFERMMKLKYMEKIKGLSS